MNSQRYIVDKVEGNLFTLQDEKGSMFIIDKSKFNKLPKEGDILIKEGDTYIIHIDLTIEYKVKINEKMKGMWVDE